MTSPEGRFMIYEAGTGRNGFEPAGDPVEAWQRRNEQNPVPGYVLQFELDPHTEYGDDRPAWIKTQNGHVFEVDTQQVIVFNGSDQK